MHVNMTQEEAQTKPTWWVSNIKSFFHLPNPRILTLFIIGSTATTLLGIAMIVEWVLHGQYHPGYFWILYYAPSLIALPILVWIICIIFAIFYTNDQSLHTLPISDLSKKQSQTEVLEQVQALQDQQAEEENGIDDYDQSQTSCLIKKPLSLQSTSRARNDIDHKLALKRTNSVQSYHTHTDYRDIRRTFSFQQWQNYFSC